jgi:hypothetical protein
MHVSPRAFRTARLWADHRGPVAQAVINGIAEQVQDHLDHGADAGYLDRIVVWMHLNQPTWHDLDAAMRYDSAPKPDVIVRTGSPCACRGGTYKTAGAPAPALVRQLLRRHAGTRPATHHRTVRRPVRTS